MIPPAITVSSYFCCAGLNYIVMILITHGTSKAKIAADVIITIAETSFISSDELMKIYTEQQLMHFADICLQGDENKISQIYVSIAMAHQVDFVFGL